MAHFQACIKPQYRQRFPQFKADTWYDVEPVRSESKTRGADLFGNRIVRLKMGGEHTSVSSEYFDIRQNPESAGRTVL